MEKAQELDRLLDEMEQKILRIREDRLPCTADNHLAASHLDELERRVDALEERVTELERGQ